MILLSGSGMGIFGCGETEIRVESFPPCPEEDGLVVCIAIRDLSGDPSEAHFEPLAVVVDEGTAVTWGYSGSRTHNLTIQSVSGPAPGPLPPSDQECEPTFSMTYTCTLSLPPASYEFSCNLHPNTGPGTLEVRARSP